MKFYDTAPRPPSVTRVLANVVAAAEDHLTARGPDKLRAWRRLEAELVGANDLLKSVG